MKMTKLTVPLADIARVENSRASIKDVADLMKSITEVGMIQPVVLAPNFTGSKEPYILVAGNRRYEAIEKMGAEQIEAVINEGITNEAQLLIINLSENIQRENVSAYEQGRYIHTLIHKHALTINECASRLALTPAMVKNILTVYERTPKEFRGDIVYNRSGKFQVGKIGIIAATAIHRLRKDSLINFAQQKRLLGDVKAGTMGTFEVSEITKRLRGGETLEQIVDKAVKTTLVRVTVPVYIREKEDICGAGVTVAVEKMLYGETKQHFTRPRATPAKRKPGPSAKPEKKKAKAS